MGGHKQSLGGGTALPGPPVATALDRLRDITEVKQRHIFLAN